MSYDGVERRATPRAPLQLPARMSGADAPVREAILRDFGARGCFLAVTLAPDDVTQPLGTVIGSNGRVRIDILAPDEGVVTLDAAVVRITVDGVAVAFDADETATLARLASPPAAAAQPQPAAPAEPSDVPADDDAAPAQVIEAVAADLGNAAINDIKDRLLAWLPGRLKAFGDQAEARLVARASKAHSNADQAPFFDAITELQRRRGELEPMLADTLLNRLDELGAPIATSDESAGPAAPSELSLVDLDEFEIFLSVAGMASKAESRNDEALYLLARRLTSIAGTVIDNSSNPLAPASVCSPFHDSLHDAPFVPEAMSIVYRTFDDLVVSDLGQLYSVVLEGLEGAGIEAAPEPVAEPRKPKSRDRGAAEPAAPEPPPEPEPPAVSEDEMLELPPAGAQPADPRASQDFGPSPFGGAAPAPRSDYQAPAESARDFWGSTVDEGPGWTPDSAPQPPAAPPAGQAPVWTPGGSTQGGAPPAGPTWTPPAAPPAGAPVWTPGGADTGSAAPAGQAPAGQAPVWTPGAAPPAAPAGAGSVDGGPMAPGTPAPVPTQFQLPARTPGTAIGAAQTMLGLNRTLANAAPGAAGGAAPAFGATGLFAGGALGNAGPGAGIPEGAQTITIEQMLALLAQLQPQPGAPPAEAAANFRTRLREAMTENEDGPVTLGGELGDAVELLMGLFEAFREDGEVEPELVTRLDMLEPAVHRAAILDQSFFDAPAHPARQLLNQLARLEPALGDSGDWPTGDFWEAIDDLLAPLIAGFENDLGLFGDVLKELDALVERQVSTYRANVASVVGACDAQQAFVQARRGMQSPEGDAAERGVSKEWAVWLNRTVRLEPGESLEMRGGAGQAPHRLVLAWVAERHTSFVFVDRAGEKALTLSRQELAMQLRRGLATIIRTSEMPLVDRALNRVLQDLHGLLERRATRDVRTGLLNRKALLARLRDQLMHPVRQGDGVGLLGFEILGHAEISERYGDEAADILLRRVARRIASVLGHEVTLACTGDSRLAAMLPDVDMARAEAVAGEVCFAVGETRVRWGEESFSPSVRAGVAVVVPGEEPGAALDTLDDRIDSHGEAGVVSAELLAPEIEAGAPGTMDYEELIAKTLSSERLQLRCHRIAPLGKDTKVRSHFEILLGVRDDEDEPIPAADFIRAAEGSGQMAAVDRWVLRNALRWMAEKRRWLRKVAGFAINLSGPSVSDPHLVEYVLDQLSQTGVPPGKVIFEITETAAVDNMDQAQNFLRTLSEVGCRFALDDFGSGQSSYGYLKQLPVDYVKIDGMFVRDLDNDAADLAVVRSVNEVAHFMGKKTVAEYVQSAETVMKLRAAGVDYGQGFFIERPRYLEETTEEDLAAVSQSLAEVPFVDPEQNVSVAEATLGL